MRRRTRYSTNFRDAMFANVSSGLCLEYIMIREYFSDYVKRIGTGCYVIKILNFHTNFVVFKIYRNFIRFFSILNLECNHQLLKPSTFSIVWFFSIHANSWNILAYSPAHWSRLFDNQRLLIINRLGGVIRSFLYEIVVRISHYANMWQKLMDIGHCDNSRRMHSTSYQLCIAYICILHYSTRF